MLSLRDSGKLAGVGPWSVRELARTYYFVFPLSLRRFVIAPQTKPIWIIAHRCNDEDDIAEALSQGANAIEFDVVSESSDFKVHHPGSVDFHTPSIGRYLEAVMENEVGLTLLYVDYKGPDFSPDACARLAGRMRDAGIPASGVKVIVSTASLDDRSWFGGAPKESWVAPQVDEGNSPDAAEEFFRTSGFAHAWYGDGITNLWFEPNRVEKNIKRAIQLRDQGTVIRGAVIWTLDDMSPMRNYLRLGVNAILTNDPADAAKVLNETEFRTNYFKADKDYSPW